MPTAPSVTASAPLSRTRWWLGVLSAPVAWSFVEGVGYVVSARQCAPGVGIATTQIRLTQLVICAVGLFVAINGLRVSLSHHRALAAATPSTAPIRGRLRFMATSGVILSALFIAGIVLFALSAVFLDVCERAI